jgi:HEAT repeat protein
MLSIAPEGGQGGYRTVDDDTRVKKVLPVLLKAMEHHNRDVRATAALSVARLGLQSAIPAVVDRTHDPDLFVRTQAVLALGFVHQPVTTERLHAILKKRLNGSEIRLVAAVGLALLGTTESIQILERYLQPATMKRLDYLLQAGVVYAAGVAAEHAPTQALITLLDTWQLQQDARLRSLLTVALGRSGAQAALPVVLRLLADDDSEVRRSAAAALGGLAQRIKPADAQLMLKLAGTEKDLLTLSNLYHALGRVQLPETRAFLQKRLTKATTLLRPHVALALGLDGDPSNADLLLNALDGEHELSVRGALITALSMIRDPRIVPILRDELSESQEPVYLSVLCRAAGLAGEADTDTIERLVELAETVHNVEVSRLAMLGLGLLGQRDEVALLAETSGNVLATMDRAGRAFAMGQVGDRDTLAPLLDLVRDERQPSYVIAYAVQALGEICDSRTRSPVWYLSRHVSLYHDVTDIYELYRVP